MSLNPPPIGENMLDKGGRAGRVWTLWFQAIRNILTNPWALAIIGTTTNDNAAVGEVGEYVSSDVLTGAAISLTDDTNANVTSISLTAGDWEVSANGFLKGGTTTSLFDARFSLSTTSATLDSSNDRLSWYVQNTTIFGNSADVSVPIVPARFSLAATTTVYLVARGNFATSTLSAYGKIWARRVR